MIPSKETRLRVVIADDEALARKRLRRFLDEEPRIEVVAECADGAEAVKVIRGKSPDLVFLDIRMPELDGFGVLEELAGIRLPAFIFVTAYDQFAARAFEIEAVDYLLKPFTRDRLQAALGRAHKRLQVDAAAANRTSLSALLATFSAQTRPFETLMIKSATGIKPLKLSEIDWITSADNYVALHIGNATQLLRATITTLAQQLSPRIFARISRSCIVNVEHILEIRRKSHGDFLVVLRNGHQLDGSRTFRKNLPGMQGGKGEM